MPYVDPRGRGEDAGAAAGERQLRMDPDDPVPTLGGANLHAETSGSGDYFAEDEMDAIRLCREVVSHLNWRKPGPEPKPNPQPPQQDPEELLGLVSRDLRSPVDVRDVIARTVDNSRFGVAFKQAPRIVFLLCSLNTCLACRAYTF